MAIFYNQATLSYNNNTTNSNIVTGELVEVLSATKTAIPATYTTGDVLTYIISIINTGNTAITGLTITDNLGAYTFNTTSVVPLTYVANSVRYFSDGILQAAPAVTAGPPLSITGISVPANGNTLVIYQATANQFAPLGATGSITNTAEISGDTITTITTSATVTASQAASLTISKSISPETVTENGQLTYTFIIQNTGNTALTSADDTVVTDLFNPILDAIEVTFNGTTWSAPANYTYDTTTGLFQTVPGQITVPAATYTQDPTTGEYIIVPGVSILRIVGTV